MGGITGFSSLMDGYMRLDDSGIGPPPKEFLQQPIGTISISFVVHYFSMVRREQLSLLLN
jgi:hypothetical protein